MKKSIFTSIMFTACLATGSMILNAQPARPAPTPNDTLVSTRITNQNEIIFSIYAPKASEVTVNGDFKNGYPAKKMVKGNNGVWTYMTGPQNPDIYVYDFTVDGVRTFDPKNTQYKEAENGLSNYVLLEGDADNYTSLKNVPHGKLSAIWIYSSILKKQIRFHVYTTPGIEKQTTPLPVLYLQHGGGDNDASWSTIGKANQILDNLYADGKIVPMVVVMPMGHPTPGFHLDLGTKEDPYYATLFHDIMPYVEKEYHVSSKRNDRAFAGLSMGGLQALNIGLFAPKVFGYVLPLSTGYFPNQLKELEEKYSKELSNPAINELKMFWIAMGGKEDIAYQNGENMKALFDKFKIKYTTHNYNGAHTFLTWRHDLADFAPLLFK